MSLGCVSTITAWVEKPANIAFADFEFTILPGVVYFPFQLAIANGKGGWIVPPTVINHGMTKRALLEREDLFVKGDLRRSMWVSLINKFHHGGLDDLTEGKTCG